MRPRLVQRFFACAALLLSSCGAALVLGEFVVRRAAPQAKPLTVALRNLHRTDRDLGYVMVPNFHRAVRTPAFTSDVRTSTIALRDREYAPHQPGTFRILGLGDSYVFGAHAGPLDSCFVKRLEARLGRELRAQPYTAVDGRKWRDMEIVNAGVIGYGTEQEIELLRRLDPVLRPDAVLLAFCLFNDFADNSGLTRMTVVEGYQALVLSTVGFGDRGWSLPRHVRLWLHANSDLYALFKVRVLHPARRALASPAGATAPGPRPLDYYIYDSGFADCLRAAPSARLEHGIAVTRAALQELRAWCDTRGTTALVVALPAELQADGAARPDWIERFGLDPSTLDFDLPNRRLAALAAEAGLPLVDLTPEFAARTGRGERLHLVGDGHWNAAGHAAAAGALAGPVRDNLLEAPAHLIGSR